MSTEETLQKVEKALEEIRPFLNSDGGDIELISIQDNIVEVQLTGACHSCSVNQMTLKSGVEMTIKKYAPEIERVINIGTDLSSEELHVDYISPVRNPNPNPNIK